MTCLLKPEVLVRLSRLQPLQSFGYSQSDNFVFLRVR